MSILRVHHLTKKYSLPEKGHAFYALADVSFAVEAGEFVAIMGESGAGKTTLLNLLATFDTPTSGNLTLNKRDLTQMSEQERATFRRRNIGFVFQDFNLLPTLSIKDNILLPLVLMQTPYADLMPKLAPLAKQLGLADLLAKYPHEISGGQKQRVAVARALITEPQLILADEPTGALDSQTGTQLLQQFQEMNRAGYTVLMVTHSLKAASMSDRVIFIRDGMIFHQLSRGTSSEEHFLTAISHVLTGDSKQEGD